MQQEEPLPEADGQQCTTEDTTSERLALAKAAFDQVEGHVSALEAKARTFLTVISLLVGAGVLSVAKGVSDKPAYPLVRIGLVLLLFLMLWFVAAAFRSLFDVLGVRKFEGHPRGTSTLDTFVQDDAATLRESLARYYADAADRNRPLAEGMVKDLKCAIQCTKRAFWFFVVATAMLTLVNAIQGEHTMQSKSGTSNQPSSAPSPGL